MDSINRHINHTRTFFFVSAISLTKKSVFVFFLLLFLFEKNTFLQFFRLVWQKKCFYLFFCCFFCKKKLTFVCSKCVYACVIVQQCHYRFQSNYNDYIWLYMVTASIFLPVCIKYIINFKTNDIFAIYLRYICDIFAIYLPYIYIWDLYLQVRYTHISTHDS